MPRIARVVGIKRKRKEKGNVLKGDTLWHLADCPQIGCPYKVDKK